MSDAQAALAVVSAVLLLVGLVAVWRGGQPPGVTQSAMAADWDRRVRDMPQHADLRGISERLATVERMCEGLRGEVARVNDAVTRVERLTNLLLEHQMDAKAP